MMIPDWSLDILSRLYIFIGLWVLNLICPNVIAGRQHPAPSSYQRQEGRYIALPVMCISSVGRLVAY